MENRKVEKELYMKINFTKKQFETLLEDGSTRDIGLLHLMIKRSMKVNLLKWNSI